MFCCTEQLNGTEKGKAFWYPGPDHSHLCSCHNTGAKVVKVHCIHRLPIRWKYPWGDHDIEEPLYSKYIVICRYIMVKNIFWWPVSIFSDMKCKIVLAASPLLVDADPFLHEWDLVSFEEEVEFSPRGNRNQEGSFQKILSRAVASHILHKPFHVCPEIFHICNSGWHGHFVEAQQSQCHPTNDINMWFCCFSKVLRRYKCRKKKSLQTCKEPCSPRGDRHPAL